MSQPSEKAMVQGSRMKNASEVRMLCCLQWLLLLLLLHVRQAVQALYMPNLAAVYVEAQKSANIKRLEAHLADKQIAGKDK